MSSFEDVLPTEADGLAMVEAWLDAERGIRPLWLPSGRNAGLAKDLQMRGADALFLESGVLRSLDVKAEARHTGNLFIEEWSNWGRKPGWVVHDTDYLAYVFLDTRTLYWMKLAELREWVFSRPFPGFERRPQARHAQKNLTVGLLVPVQQLIRAGIAQGFFEDKADWVPVTQWSAA